MIVKGGNMDKEQSNALIEELIDLREDSLDIENKTTAKILYRLIRIVRDIIEWLPKEK